MTRRCDEAQGESELSFPTQSWLLSNNKKVSYFLSSFMSTVSKVVPLCLKTKKKNSVAFLPFCGNWESDFKTLSCWTTCYKSSLALWFDFNQLHCLWLVSLTFFESSAEVFRFGNVVIIGCYLWRGETGGNLILAKASPGLLVRQVQFLELILPFYPHFSKCVIVEPKKKAPECCFSISHIPLPVLVDASVTPSAPLTAAHFSSGYFSKQQHENKVMCSVITRCLILNNEHLLRWRFSHDSVLINRGSNLGIARKLVALLEAKTLSLVLNKTIC